MKLPKLTKKQQEILELLYEFRFLNRIQIQALMGHRDYKTINLWLRDLRDKEYVEWIYSTDFAEKTKPAIYYVGLNGVRFLKQLTDADDNGDMCARYAIEELRKRYRDDTRSRTYIDRCILLADCCIVLRQHRQAGISYFYETEADYLSKSGRYHFILGDELIHPHLCISKDKDGATADCYVVEVFDPTLPRYRMKKRLGDYVKHLEAEDYEWRREMSVEGSPTVMFVCPRVADLIYAKRRMRGLLADAWEGIEGERPNVLFTTIEKLKMYGILAREIWEKA